MAAETFEQGGSPLYARLAREHAENPALVAIAGAHKPRWEVPVKVFAGVHLLVLTGELEDPWSRFGEVVAERREWLARFVAEQPIQTNEVQRSWALLPAFLTLAGSRPLDLVELGPSAGLNLVWDRYRYRYGEATWGPADSPVELAGEALGGPPRRLFHRDVVVRGRVGIDRAPLDVTSESDALLLQCFVWADQRARLDRLRRAIEVARRDPPRLLRGDYVERLPAILSDRPADGLTVVYHSVSSTYLRDDERARLAAAIEAAGEGGPLAWVAYELAVDDEAAAFDRFALDLRVWPGGEPRRLARLDGHGNRMQWLPR